MTERAFPESRPLDRRRHHRVPCGLVLSEVGPDATTPCRATNISESGIYLRRLAGGVLLEGETVALELRLPGDDDSLWLSGRVVEQIEEVFHDAAAIEFVSVTRRDRARLRRYVQRARLRQFRAAVVGLSSLASPGAAAAPSTAPGALPGDAAHS